MGKRVLLLVNSSSGQEKGKALLYSFVEEFAKKNCVVTVFPILPRSRKLSTDSIVHKYKDAFDLIVCVGGDGTLHYLVSSVLKRDYKFPSAIFRQALQTILPLLWAFRRIGRKISTGW